MVRMQLTCKCASLKADVHPNIITSDLTSLKTLCLFSARKEKPVYAVHADMKHTNVWAEHSHSNVTDGEIQTQELFH
jgi:hypothetical protein